MLFDLDPDLLAPPGSMVVYPYLILLQDLHNRPATNSDTQHAYHRNQRDNQPNEHAGVAYLVAFSPALQQFYP